MERIRQRTNDAFWNVPLMDSASEVASSCALEIVISQGAAQTSATRERSAQRNISKRLKRRGDTKTKWHSRSEFAPNAPVVRLGYKVQCLRLVTVTNP